MSKYSLCERSIAIVSRRMFGVHCHDCKQLQRNAKDSQQLLADGMRDGTGQLLRKDESIPVDPAGVLWVERHELVEQDVGDRGHAHRRTGVPGVGVGSRIDLQLPSVSPLSSVLSSRSHEMLAISIVSRAPNTPRRNSGGAAAKRWDKLTARHRMVLMASWSISP